MKVGLDTNVLVYAEGVNGPDRQAAALAVIGSLPRSNLVTPLQALEELFNVLIHKKRWSAKDAQARIVEWCHTTSTIETSQATLLTAIELVARHKLRIWDALILAAAAEAGCRLLLSEDMQDGFTWGGLTVVDPFREPPSPLLEGAVRS